MPNTPVPAAGEAMPTANITRRAVIAAAGISATAVALPAHASKPFRLAEVTAAFEQARLEFHAAIDFEQSADQAWRAVDTKEPILGPKINGCMMEVRGRDRDDAYDYQENAIAQFGHKLRRDLAAIGADASIVDDWELRMTEEAIAAVEAWQARRDACGLTAAEELLHATMNGETDALLAVLAYRPVSADDAREKVVWILARQSRHDISGLHGAFEYLLETLLPEGEELHEQENGDWAIVATEAS